MPERHDHGQNLIGIVRIEFSPSHSFCGRSMFWRMTGYWPDSVDAAKSGTSGAQGNCTPVPDPK
jgi:hypothetical protein